MDEKFLYQNRPPVRQGFGENLYTRISTQAQQQRRTNQALRFIVRLGWVALLLFAGLAAFSQPVRASILSAIRYIAGFVVEERDSVSTANAEPTPVSPGDHDDPVRTLEDLPYKLSMPAYVPNGFTFENKMDVENESALMRWLNAAGDEILMLVDTEHGQHYLAGTAGAQEIEINGKPALLIQGGYDTVQEWDPDLKMINVLQRRDDVIYWLIYIKNSEGGFENAVELQEQLIHMMSSIP
ncbi:MAG: DUF4367 domain-containing protein [Chloroflexota bacterium]